MRKAGLVIILVLGIFIFAPRSTGAFSLPTGEAEKSDRISSARPIEQSQFKTPTLAAEGKAIYEINGKSYRLNDNQTLTALPQKSKVKPEVKNTPEVKINTPAQTKPIAQSEDKKENKKPNAAINLFLNKKELQVSQTKVLAGKDKSDLPVTDTNIQGNALTLKEVKSDAENKGRSLDVLNIGKNNAGKSSLVAQNQIKLEGLPEDKQEEESIQITPKIKVQSIYQGSSVQGNAEQKTGNFYFEKILVDRR